MTIATNKEIKLQNKPWLTKGIQKSLKQTILKKIKKIQQMKASLNINKTGSHQCTRAVCSS